ncbi:MAG: NADH-quinone oxidoreductase subunit J [Myxococcales bacterium]|jgi:NADH-quinone oxidoreductase subunit J|nr:NADH-quinone oxidoreductase subunit J [Myxococcales bacterium]
MTAEQFFFYVFGAGMLAGALGVVGARNPVNGALSLVTSFFFLAGLYVLLNAHFMAVLQILVYAGAIVVLFLFVLMLLNLGDDEHGKGKISLTKLAGVGTGAAVMVTLMGAFTGMRDAGLTRGTELSADFGSIEVVGRVLLSRYVLPFEMVSVLLLTGIVGAVVVAKRRL